MKKILITGGAGYIGSHFLYCNSKNVISLGIAHDLFL